MPQVSSLPIGNNAQIIKGLDSRLRSLEARRTAEGVSITTIPELTVQVLTADAAFVILGGFEYISIDGGTPVLMTLLSAQQGPVGEVISAQAFTGLTPGWHTFTAANGLVVGTPFLIVWTF